MEASGDNSPDAIIAGFGLPGREVAARLESLGRSFCVIELNPATVQRCAQTDIAIIAGDCTDPQVLVRAGIERARLFIVAIPDEHAAVTATAHARGLNPSLRIITRCHFTSTGIEAKAKGADEVVVAEQAVAAEMALRIAPETIAQPQP